MREDVERRGTAEQGERQPDAHPGHRLCAAQHLDSDHINPEDRKAKDSVLAAKAVEHMTNSPRRQWKQEAEAVSHPGRPAKTMVLPMKPPPNLHMSDLADKLVALWRDENRFCPATVLTEHCRSPPSSQWPSFSDTVAENK